MSKIVFLNMADDLHVDGRKAVDALKMKHPDQFSKYLKRRKKQVFEIEMVPFFRAWKNGVHSTAELVKIRKKVSGAKTVMLSIHGPMDAVDHALIRDPQGGPGEKVGYRKLGELIRAIFSASECHNFTLVTCFAARSGNFAINHTQLNLVDWTNSFAYKLFNEITPQREVRMTARIGELSFNTVSGESEVQSELSIQGTIDNAAIQTEAAVVQSQAWWAANVAALMNGDTHNQFVIDLTMANNQVSPALKLVGLRALLLNPGLPAGGNQSVECLKYLRNLIRLTDAASRQNDPVRGKYGKLVYRYINGPGICVFAKYPVPTMVHPVPATGPYQANANLLKKFNKAG